MVQEALWCQKVVSNAFMNATELKAIQITTLPRSATETLKDTGDSRILSSLRRNITIKRTAV